MRLSSRASLATAACLAVLACLLTFLCVRSGSMGTLSGGEVVRGVLGTVGIGEGVEGVGQDVVRLRLWRALAALAVGASLALAGGYLQGLFRNGLASPSVVGVTAGSVLGASIAIALIGGYGAELVQVRRTLLTPALVTAFALVGALVVTWLVVSLASTGRRLSVPTLLLAGIAMNTLVGGLLAALQSFTMKHFEVSQAIMAWTFGTLDDRTGWQVALAWGGLVLALGAIPFVALELDLFGGGEHDAESLGVDVQRVKAIVLVCAATSIAASVSVAGQIPFVGLVIPHVVRSLTGPSHRTLLPLSALLGGVFLLGCDLAQHTFLPDAGIRPGVLMSLVGGPFFLYLLVRNKRALSSW